MNKPIKRSENLVLLSREHHEGLLIVWKIRQGIKYGVSEMELSNFVLHEFANHLEPHFLDEEKILFPTLREDDQFRKDAEEQHSRIRNIVAAIQIASTEELDPSVRGQELLEEFVNHVDNHIRYEERTMFPYIERTADEIVLKRIGEQLAISHNLKKPEVWANAFWLKPTSF